MSKRTLLLALVVATQVGCGNPTRPVVPAAGSWAGTLADDTVGAGTFRLELENPSGTQLVGTWSATVSGQTVQGVASGSATTTPNLLNMSCAGGGVGNMTFTVAGNRIHGTYFFFGSPACPLLDDGSVDLNRQ